MVDLQNEEKGLLYQKAHQLRPPPLLSTGFGALDQALKGGYAQGHIYEFGMPRASHSRCLLLKFLAQHRPLTLWAYAEEGARPQKHLRKCSMN